MLAIAAFFLSGCASNSTPLAEILSKVVSEKLAKDDDSKLIGKPNPDYRYLRVEVEGHRPAFLVLGYIDAHPLGNIEVWYSAQQELIKTQNGRIVGTAGLKIDWRNVQFPSPPPEWAARASQGGAYPRVRDEIPDHRYAITDQIELQPWQGVPPITLPASLNAEQARTYAWFREAALTSSAEVLPPAWYAWGMYRGIPSVVYSQQCLSTSFCLKLQLWPAQEGTR